MATATVELTLGHPQIDAQHREITRLIGEVHRAIGAEDPVAAHKALAALWDETVGHFATEEALMEEHAYPERNAHRTAHHLFLEDLRELVRELDAHGIGEEVATWALQRVPEWVSFHIETNDAPLARFLARKQAARLVAVARGVDEKPARRDA